MDSLGAKFGSSQGRKGHASTDRGDGNAHEQFDQGKRFAEYLSIRENLRHFA